MMTDNLEKFLVPKHAKSLSTEMSLAINAVKKAGNIIRENFAGIHSIEEKGIGDLVSEIDRQAECAGTNVLLKDPRDVAILSEEMNPNTKSCDGNLWIFDPLDSTGGFLMGAGPEYPAVLLSELRNNQLTLGIVLFPLTNEWFYAEKGKGAWKNGVKLKIAQNDISLYHSWLDMNHYGDASYETNFFINLRQKLRSNKGCRLVTSMVPHSGIAMRIAESKSNLTAAIHDNNPLKPKQAAWDIAAPQLIFEEAGGVFINPQGQRTDLFNPEPIIIARTKELAMDIVNLGHS